jgi:dTDP-4-dehydrorhamnose reductase
LLGSTLVPRLRDCGHTVLEHGFAQAVEYRADLRDYDATAAMLNQAAPECIINLAALTDVDVCERDPDAAYRLNVAAVEHLSRWIAHHAPGCHLVQISTDHVYDGVGPHREAAIAIRNVYALSKAAAELIARAIGGTVLRTNFFGKSSCPRRSSFSDWIVESLRGDRPLRLYTDVHFSPVRLRTLSDLIERVVVTRPAGIFNVGAAGGMSKADFAFALAEALALPTGRMQRVDYGAAPHFARRPSDMRMDCGLFENTLGQPLPSLADEIVAAREEYL